MKRRKEGKSNGNLPLQIPINNGSTNRMGKTCKGLKNVLRHFRGFFPCKLVESTYLCLFSAQKQTTNTLCRLLWWKEFMSCVWTGYSNY